MQNKLFQQLKKGTGAQQLIFFPYLGGHADNFITLAESLSTDFEIWSANLPGHGKCTELELLEDINSVINLYANEIKKIIKPNCIFFGHSMGGIIAYFLLHHLINVNNFIEEKTTTLILSACATPAEFKKLSISSLSDEELLNRFRTYSAIPGKILQDKSLLDYLIPIYRTDFKILESSSLCKVIPLSVPVYFLWGENDKIVAIDSVLKWSNYFTSQINLLPIKNASHMFIHEQCFIVKQVIEKIVLGNC